MMWVLLFVLTLLSVAHSFSQNNALTLNPYRIYLVHHGTRRAKRSAKGNLFPATWCPA